MQAFSDYKEALRKVLFETVHNANYRRRILSGNREEALAAITLLVSEAAVSTKILNLLYEENGTFKQKNVSSKAGIKLMAFVCCSLKAAGEAPLDPSQRAKFFPLSAQQTPAEYFEAQEDWESL
jgi:hypothetical protein